MRKLVNFVGLDFATIQPYLSLKTCLIYLAVCIFVTLTTRNADIGLSATLMMGMIMMSYPFAIGEKCNLDALYVTLALPRSTVVSGRYLFTALMDLLTAVLGLAAVGLLSLFEPKIRQSLLSPGQGLALSSIFLTFCLLQALQLPAYFKLGYSKARLAGLLPYAVLVLLVALLGNLPAGLTQSLTSLLQTLTRQPLLTALTALLAIGLSWLLSARIALVFYRKREF
ncbi:MAG: ABC-2 transporter permease [Oscillospiraceae bacterium]|nr:ABC-2 transporter permease [Oscillospiraceae bacterium]MDD4368139.1 ABC-2 transporter permease [Oscillospiraceae bacterium]